MVAFFATSPYSVVLSMVRSMVARFLSMAPPRFSMAFTRQSAFNFTSTILSKKS